MALTRDKRHRQDLRRLCVGMMVLAGLAVGGPWVAADEKDTRESVYGIWATSGTMIEVGPDGDGLSARIVALKNPNWRDKDGVGRVGEAKTDLHNPDQARHGEPMLGLEMLSDYTFTKGKWRGRLYLPSNGSYWKSSAWVKKGKLRLRGYVGVAMFGKTQVFMPLASCNEDILRMIEISGMADTPCDLPPARSGDQAR